MEEWQVKISRGNDGHYYATVKRGGFVVLETWAHRFITGAFTPMRYWFKPLEKRVEMATQELLDEARKRLEKENDYNSGVARLNEIAAKVAKEATSR